MAARVGRERAAADKNHLHHTAPRFWRREGEEERVGWSPRQHDPRRHLRRQTSELGAEWMTQCDVCRGMEWSADVWAALNNEALGGASSSAGTQERLETRDPRENQLASRITAIRGSSPGGFTPGFSQMGLVLDNAACRMSSRVLEHIPKEINIQSSSRRLFATCLKQSRDNKKGIARLRLEQSRSQQVRTMQTPVKSLRNLIPRHDPKNASNDDVTFVRGAAVAERLDCSPSTKAFHPRPGHSRIVPDDEAVGGFPPPPALSFRRCSTCGVRDSRWQPARPGPGGAAPAVSEVAGSREPLLTGTPSEESREQRRNARPGEMGDPRENPPTSGIVWRDSHMRRIPEATPPGIEPCSRWWEASSLTTTPPGPPRNQSCGRIAVVVGACEVRDDDRPATASFIVRGVSNTAAPRLASLTTPAGFTTALSRPTGKNSLFNGSLRSCRVDVKLGSFSQFLAVCMCEVATCVVETLQNVPGTNCGQLGPDETARDLPEELLLVTKQFDGATAQLEQDVSPKSPLQIVRAFSEDQDGYVLHRKVPFPRDKQNNATSSHIDLFHIRHSRNPRQQGSRKSRPSCGPTGSSLAESSRVNVQAKQSGHLGLSAIDQNDSDWLQEVYKLIRALVYGIVLTWNPAHFFYHSRIGGRALQCWVAQLASSLYLASPLRLEHGACSYPPCCRLGRVACRLIQLFVADLGPPTACSSRTLVFCACS
ncbi:hypothetical protein PR048_003778 [Dryococelus australis]|uniref:Uncharacterized protein n=1 Tax=Dryococelus australis TaxID=614101 RepID=A0ABQ9IQP3_9NEOP|nr:hypothetical protein PR048_003778 [Dryococelus australis]